MNIYEELRKKHYFYTQGKNPRVLKASCEYIENMLNHIHITQEDTARKYGVASLSIRKHYVKIIELLNIPIEGFEEWNKRAVTKKMRK